MKNPIICSVLCSLLVLILASNAGGVNFCSWSTNSFECQKSEFTCLTGKCINRAQYCDGTDNCGDNSDEKYCRVSACPENYVSCGISWRDPAKCIPAKWECDGYSNCPDGTDEYDCRNRNTANVNTRSESATAKGQNSIAMNKVKQWLNDQRNELNSAEKWGSNVDRLASIFYLTNISGSGFFRSSSDYKAEMVYELSIQMLSRLSSMKLENIPSTELASYLNAFLGMCVNPRNFHGHDIVQELRNRVDKENYTNPYVFLALCNAGETITEADKNKLIDTFENKHRTFWTELASYLNAFLGMCINPRNFHGHDIVQELRNRVDKENYTNPYVFLALCNAGETITEADKNKLIDTFENKHRTFWTELGSYLNAFLGMCVNPRNFHGHDIVQELGNRVDKENYTNPYVFLALCNAGETITEVDKNKLIDTFENKHRTFWTGMQAVVVMALSCTNKQQGNEADSETLREMTLELKQQQYRNGTVVDLPTTALVMQALISTHSEGDPDNFDEMKAFQELLRNQKSDGSFGDVMNTFLVTPVLTCKSLADINSSHCQYGSRDETSALEDLSRRNGPKTRVQYSLWIGNEKDLERNLILRVPQNMSLYGVMEIAAEVDSRFKLEYSVKNRKPYVNAISGMRDNPLTGKFWFLNVIQDGKPTLLNESPADIIPKDNDHYVMWYKRGTWVG